MRADFEWQHEKEDEAKTFHSEDGAYLMALLSLEIAALALIEGEADSDVQEQFELVTAEPAQGAN
jgi:hypothetical protein